MQIAHMLKNFTLPVTGTLGFDYAQVTRGGIDMGGITDRLESKLVKNLYFAGEVLDVDGDCGGYNLQWAWASGKAAGTQAAQWGEHGAGARKGLAEQGQGLAER